MGFLITLCILGSTYGKIQGIVTDQDTKEPIPYVDVIIQNTEMGTATLEDGRFYILNVPSGTYKVEISCVGYQTKIIEQVIVEIDHTARLTVELSKTTIEMEPITVVSETPVVQKDYVGTTYIIRPTEFSFMQIDYTSDIIAFQPSVAHTESTLHVRGGRATEVLYLIDNVSIIDPQTGEPAIALSKGVINEVIFLPGGFDVEYGRAMSGVINLITERPANTLKGKASGKTEEFMPYYYDFGYQNAQAAVHLPVSQRFKGLFSLDIMHTDDWDPRLFILPHKQRDDYSVYGKWFYQPSGMMNIALSGVMSRIQFDRYAPGKFRLLADDWRSDLRKGNLQAMNVNIIPDSRKLVTLTLSRLFTKRTYGVRELRSYDVFEDFRFRPYTTYTKWHYDHRNPWGVWTSQWHTHGTYDGYEEKTSQVIKTNVQSRLQMHQYHEIHIGGEYAYQDFDNFTFILSNKDTANPIADDYRHKPTEYAIYVQDNIDFRGLYAKIGGRLDYYDSDIEEIESKTIISPRVGFSFMVTETFLFRVNIGKYTQPPLYDHMYTLYHVKQQYPHLGLSPIGNPNLGPEKTMSYEIGLQGEIRQSIMGTFTAFYKDITDLVGTRYVPALPENYIKYINVEFANAKGIEAIFEYNTSSTVLKLSYTLSWARGTSSYAEDIYYRYYAENPDTSIIPTAEEYPLSFDQRHRIYLQGQAYLPFNTTVYLLCYFGNGFSYEEPGPEGNLKERYISYFPFQKQIDCMISRPFQISNFSICVQAEIINVLGIRNQIAQHAMFIKIPDKKDFDDYIPLTSWYYGPPADVNHDGLITPQEEYNAYVAAVRATDDWVNAYSEPRRARIGVIIKFN
jgi:outer membrane cobalamin receptor